MNIKLKAAIEKLLMGEKVENYSEGGNSMVPKICSKEPVTLEPVEHSKLERGDIVLARVHGKIYMHLISALKPDEVQISNNKNFVNGWTKRENVYGIVTEVNGRIISSARSKVKIKEKT